MYPNAPNNVDIVSEYCELSDDGKEVLTLLNVVRLQPSMVGFIQILKFIKKNPMISLLSYWKSEK